jgi:hypothetical protein
VAKYKKAKEAPEIKIQKGYSKLNTLQWLKW